MKRVKAIVDGIVQGVGYRYNVKHIAIKNKIKGYVKNLDDGRVEIVAEGDDQALGRFLNDIGIKRGPILVESIDVSYEEPTGEFKAFKIITGSLEDEMVEGFSTGAMYFNIVINKQDLMLEKQDQTLAKLDLMLEKQDRMLEKQDLMLEKQDQTLAKLDDLKVSMVEEIRALREDIKAILDKRLSKIEEDITKIKIKLGMV